MSHLKIKLLLASTALSLGGCATITTGTKQSFEVLVEGVDTANCVLYKADFGPLKVAPSTPVSIPRSDAPLSVRCDQQGFQTASLTVNAQVQNRAKYELPFGMFVDYMTGARYEYPAQVTLRLTPLLAAVSLN